MISKRILPTAAALLLLTIGGVASAQTANAPSGSSSSSAGTNSTRGSATSGSGATTSFSSSGTATTGGGTMNDPSKPAIGGNTKTQLDEEKKNNKDMTICKGC